MKACEINPATWKPAEEAVLCFIRDIPAHRILLIHKKTGLGAGLINAPGGRIEKNETPAQAAKRETLEEVGLITGTLSHAGDLYFQFTDGYSLRGYVFQTFSWQGEPKETEEANPFWCSESEIPYHNMWVDDSWWIPHMLEGEPFSARFVFRETSMLSMNLNVESSDGKTGIPRKRKT